MYYYTLNCTVVDNVRNRSKQSGLKTNLKLGKIFGREKKVNGKIIPIIVHKTSFRVYRPIVCFNLVA